MSSLYRQLKQQRSGRSSVANCAEQSGVTLVELMVSMVLGLILIFAATTLYEITKRTTRAQEATARLMENGRAATELLNRSVRMARYFGCAGVETTSVRNHFDDSNDDESPVTLNGYNQQGIFGVEGASGANDEIIIFRALDDSAADLAEDVTLSAGANPVKLTTDAGNPAAGDMIAVTDCTQGDVFNTTARSTDTGTGLDSFTYANCGTCGASYLANATVLQVARERFYIDTGESGLNSLFVADPNDPGTATELIEGVEQMQIRYGIETDADPDGVANQYVLPATIRTNCASAASGLGNNTCWRNVTSVRIALLLATVENTITTKPQKYTFDGTDYTATDRRLRREFLSIIALRNYRP